MELLHVDPGMRRPEIFERHQGLDEKIARTAPAAALEAEMERSGDLDERAQELLLRLFRGPPELLPDLVTLEVSSSIEELDAALELVAQISCAF